MIIFSFRGYEIEISDADVQRFIKLVKFDLSPALVRLNHAKKEIHVKAFKLFILSSIIIRRLDGEDKIRVNPTKAVDGIWHMVLLYTRIYADFSQSVAGFFIHHDASIEVNKLIRLTPNEFEELLRFFENLAPEHAGYFSRVHCEIAGDENAPCGLEEWSPMRIEFEDLHGVFELRPLMEVLP